MQKGRFRPKTTDSLHGGPIARNLLQKASLPTLPNQVWVTDVTYIETTAGWRYLSATLDLCTRKIFAWNLFDTLETSLCTTTLQLALEAERPDTRRLTNPQSKLTPYPCPRFRGQVKQQLVRYATVTVNRVRADLTNAARRSFLSDDHYDLRHRLL